MRAIIAARTVIAGVAVLGLVTGCSDVGLGSEPGTPTAAEPEMDNLLDPCTDIPDEWLIETGLDPSTERNVVNPDKISSWRICGWKPTAANYRMDLLSTSKTIEDARANPNLTILREITIGDRAGIVSKDDFEGARSCYISLPAEQGMFEIAVDWFGDRPAEAQCDLAIKHATDLEPHLPK
ncbi:DUF3558 domain-containing protein [Nocardia higoensis]|uniref:DUF3558 domain-containing protein n=1 Tax=Nocardia higoensis TaxID=228599 RepID=A0ABS0DFC0_9NOCA|nr:DUF3558 domain-containing protein [Nocardia higoensis]MBF6357172.1 DUF3558 domain-containing protein [Nocardia higoensis]